MLLNHEHWFYTRTNFFYVQKQKLKYRNNNSNHHFPMKSKIDLTKSNQSKLHRDYINITVIGLLCSNNYTRKEKRNFHVMKISRFPHILSLPHLSPPFIQHLPTIFSLMLSIIIILTRTKYAKYVLLYFIEKSPLIIERLTHTV